MSWRERDEGARAFERGQSRWSSNPHDDGYSADYDERRNHRDWEDGHRGAERREERRREEEQAERQEQHRRDELRQEQEELEKEDGLAEQCATERGEG